MGQIKSVVKYIPSGHLEKSDSMESIDENNGLFLCETYLPPEIVTHILSFVDHTSLRKNCSRVCHQWNELIKDFVWKIKAERVLRRRLKRFQFELYMSICVRNPFDRNLLRNTCGENGRDSWRIESEGGGGFCIENPPCGCEVVPKELGDTYSSCFATSFYSCSKSQVIDLLKEGIPAEILDKLQPPIYVSEWYGSRFDCGCIYEMEVKLLDAKKEKVLKEFKFRVTVEQWQGGTWRKLDTILENYGPGVRYVYFYHGGQDTQFWAGHYGSKMTGAIVKFDTKWFIL